MEVGGPLGHVGCRKHLSSVGWVLGDLRVDVLRNVLFRCTLGDLT